MRRFGIPPLSAAEQVSKEIFFENEPNYVPLPLGTPGVLKFADVSPIGDPTDILHFHCIGDSGGIKDPNPQGHVASVLAQQQSVVDFLYHVGDVVYFNGDANEYYPQFYEPYAHYNLPIFAIPGNHDGDNSDDPSVPSLTAFVENFCATSPHLTQEAQDSNRDAMTQPYVYWSLQCNLAYFIGLYSNVPSGGYIDDDQIAWFVNQLKVAPGDRILIVALHHPPYSADDHHGGSAKMATILDQAFTEANRWPDLILAGHVHNYQRFERTVDGKTIPYIVNGAGGYHNLHSMAPVGRCPWRVPTIPDLTLEAYCDTEWGFLHVVIGPGKLLSGQYVSVDRDGNGSIVDSFNYLPPAN